jgi:hypothetical protein
VVKGIRWIAFALVVGPAVLIIRSAKTASPAAGAATAKEARGGAPTGAAQGACQLHGISVPGFSVEKLPAAQFNALHAAVAPRGEGERWKEIPWESDLWAAKQRAAREGKPLLMWVMDGNPLGCT